MDGKDLINKYVRVKGYRGVWLVVGWDRSGDAFRVIEVTIEYISSPTIGSGMTVYRDEITTDEAWNALYGK